MKYSPVVADTHKLSKHSTSFVAGTVNIHPCFLELDFSCLLRFSVLASWQTAQYKQQEQIYVVVSDILFGQHSMNVA